MGSVSSFQMGICQKELIRFLDLAIQRFLTGLYKIQSLNSNDSLLVGKFTKNLGVEHSNSPIKLENIAKDYCIFVHMVPITQKKTPTMEQKIRPLQFSNTVTISSPSKGWSTALHTNTKKTGLLKKELVTASVKKLIYDTETNTHNFHAFQSLLFKRKIEHCEQQSQNKLFSDYY